MPNTNRFYRQLTGYASGSQLRTATFDGREHIVVPVVAMVAGSVVRPMNGDGSGELVTLEVLQEAPSQWNGRPVTADHPDNGTVSANEPHVLERERFGHVFNARVHNGKLKVEAWLDPQQAEKIGPRALAVIERLKRKEQVEVSVGAFVTLEERSGKTPQGAKYDYVWVNVASDHLALLREDAIGACSIEMGCGALRANSAKPEEGVMKENKGILQRVLAFIAAKGPEISNRTLHEKLWQALRATVPGLSELVDIYPESSRVIYGTWVNENWQMFQRTYKDEDGNVVLNDDQQEVQAVTQFVPLSGKAAKGVTELIDELIAAGNFSDDDRATLEQFSIDKLAQLVSSFEKADTDGTSDNSESVDATAAPSNVPEEASVKASASKQKPECGCKATDVVAASASCDCKTKEHVPQPATLKAAGQSANSAQGNPKMSEIKKQLIGRLVANEASPFTTDDWKALENFDEDRLRVLLDKYAPETPPPTTDEEWLALAPSSLQSMVRRYLAEDAERRGELIAALRAAQDEYPKEDLQRMQTEELQRLARVLGLDRRIDYSGRGAFSANSGDAGTFEAPDPYKAGVNNLKSRYGNA